MKSEETIYENTTLDETKLDSNKKQVSDKESADATKKGQAWKKAATGMGTGVLLGSIASFAFTHAAHAATDDGHTENNDDTSTDSNSAWADDSVAVATTVSDDMTFSQAFAAARAEVGPGGAFEWHGNVYGTYTAEEWNNMSAEEREEYNNHFNWSNHHDSSNSEQQSSDSVAENQDAETADNQQEEHTEEHAENLPEEQTTDPAAEIEVIAVNPEDTTPEVEILGVVHDEETGANIGGMMVDGQEVFLIDVDGGGTFDYIAADLNNDGQITADEYADISAENITVSQFDNSSDANAMYASNDGETDYINDDVIA